MSETKTELKDIISFTVHRNIVNLYKKYFEITEDLLREHRLYKDRIRNIPASDDSQNIDNLDYFTEERFNQIRKKILDAGNDATREIDKALEFVTVNLKKDQNE